VNLSTKDNINFAQPEPIYVYTDIIKPNFCYVVFVGSAVWLPCLVDLFLLLIIIIIIIIINIIISGHRSSVWFQFGFHLEVRLTDDIPFYGHVSGHLAILLPRPVSNLSVDKPPTAYLHETVPHYIHNLPAVFLPPPYFWL